jgi:nucleoid DNA-binding protein
MNKKTLISKISARSNLRKGDCEKFFNRVMELVYDEIKRNKFYEIEDFGKFQIEHRTQSADIDKRTGEELLLPPKDKMRFYPSQALQKKLNPVG